MKRIGYARVSTSAQDTDRQVVDLLAAGVRRDDLYMDRGVSGARASRPEFDRALAAPGLWSWWRGGFGGSLLFRGFSWVKAC